MPSELRLKIVGHLGVGEMAGVAALTRRDSVITRLVFKKRVHRRLTLFRLPPSSFMDLLDKSCALISGSFVLSLSRRPEDDFEPGDIDVYVPWSKYGALVQGLQHLGYRRDPTYLAFEQTRSYDVEYSAIKRVDVFLSNIQGLPCPTRIRPSINVISVMSEDPRAAIFLFHSTVVMNYMDSISVTICYPSLTLRHLSLTNEWNTIPLANRVRGWAKYQCRGVVYFPDCKHPSLPSHQCASGNAAACYYCERSTDDGQSLTFAFDRRENAVFHDETSCVRWRLAVPGKVESGFSWTKWEVFGDHVYSCLLSVSHKSLLSVWPDLGLDGCGRSKATGH
jgi:hypothetical protein